ncbi:aldose 1-epimerase family protein [Microbacterium indicum]|uniref:aldose 1-epimerase family protein n=1 Tax=Microbacterium indicum TaxID=358100 RepID=UPI0003FF5118|nr:aldose 1-epimerase family protein [Microbacterium indicum]
MAIDPTGTQIRIERGDVAAHIAQVGASLRGLTVGGTGVVTPYPEGARTPFGSGIVLVPWPNRVRDGKWSQTDPHGTAYDEQLAITEPKLSNAIHGLLRYTPYNVTVGEGTATLSAAIVPQAGYDFALETSVTYALTDDGIRVTHRLENVGARPAPVGIGVHPFFQIEGVPTGELTLTSPADTFFAVDDRLLPLSEDPVEGDNDLRGGKVLGEVPFYDTAFGGLARDEHGLVGHTLTAPDGRVLTIWQDESFDYAQVFTTDGYPGQDLAVAIEPMTMPAEALNSGQGLRWLEPGEVFEASWGVALSA